MIGQRNTIKEVTILNNYLQVIFTEKVQTEQQYNEFKKADVGQDIQGYIKSLDTFMGGVIDIISTDDKENLAFVFKDIKATTPELTVIKKIGLTAIEKNVAAWIKSHKVINVSQLEKSIKCATGAISLALSNAKDRNIPSKYLAKTIFVLKQYGY